MKEFLKWLGVNEKVAKVAVWMLIIMIFLIITNTMLESLGFSYYKITVDNISNINVHEVTDYLVSAIIVLFNFYTVIFLVFRINDFKKILPYSIIFVVLNGIIYSLTNYVISQVYIMSFYIIFSYLYSKKNKKYILYSIGSIIINVFIQYIWFMYKGRFVDLTTISNATQTILTIDFFIIMFIIIISKEIYLKKRSEKGCHVYSGLENSNKKENLQKK